MMNIPLGDFSGGSVVQPPFQVKDQWIMPNICYEDLFGNEIAQQIAAGADSSKPQPTILLNLSNIAWFGDTIALPQHLQISQLRALETGRPMLRSTNTGTTAVIDPHGNITARLTPYSRGTLEATVQGFGGITPFVRIGDAGVVWLSLCALGVAWLVGRRR